MTSEQTSFADAVKAFLKTRDVEVEVREQVDIHGVTAVFLKGNLRQGTDTAPLCALVWPRSERPKIRSLQAFLRRAVGCERLWLLYAGSSEQSEQQALLHFIELGANGEVLGEDVIRRGEQECRTFSPQDARPSDAAGKCGPLLDELRRAVEEASSEYIRSTPLCAYRVDGHASSLDLRDLLLIGAITESDVLLTGKTGSGKTRLANAVMKGLFGSDGVYNRTTNPGMTVSDFIDIDFESIQNGTSLKKAVRGMQSLKKPGVVLNEVNRAPGLIQSLLIAFLDRELEVMGVAVEMGRSWADGSRCYQYRILTINEGGDYNVRDMDPAIRDRMTIEIPVDAFPQSREDVLTMLRREPQPAAARPAGKGKIEPKAGHFEAVCKMRKEVDCVPVPDACVEFLAYLGGMSYCIRALRGNKESLLINDDTCGGCVSGAVPQGLCGNVRAPSARILLRLQRIAQAFALFRCHKAQWRPRLEVAMEDIIEAAPFVLYWKLGLSSKWLAATVKYRGDRWTAMRDIISEIYNRRFLPFQNDEDMRSFLAVIAANQEPTLGQLNAAFEYLKKDAWAYDPAAVRRRIEIQEGARRV